jgi:hypothetical protein
VGKIICRHWHLTLLAATIVCVLLVRCLCVEGVFLVCVLLQPAGIARGGFVLVLEIARQVFIYTRPTIAK